jgi:hypothetical protein
MGSDDVYLGGYQKVLQVKIYGNNGKNNFSSLSQVALESDSNFSSSKKFFDVDNGNDQDLLVGSGGNEKRIEPIIKNKIVHLSNGKDFFSKKAYLQLTIMFSTILLTISIMMAIFYRGKCSWVYRLHQNNIPENDGKFYKWYQEKKQFKTKSC